MNNLPEYWENALLDALDGEIGGFGEEYVVKAHTVSTDIFKRVLRDVIEYTMQLGYDQVWAETEQKDIAENWRRDFRRYTLPALFKKYNCDSKEDAE